MGNRGVLEGAVGCCGPWRLVSFLVLKAMGCC